jgi:hypothetical protein
MRYSAINAFALNPWDERDLMEDAEWEQTQCDGFWGLDAEENNMSKEKELMRTEDERSIAHHKWLALLNKREEWIEEAEFKASLDEAEEVAQTMQKRKEYMKMLFKSTSLANFIKFDWNDNQNATLEKETFRTAGSSAQTKSVEFQLPGKHSNTHTLKTGNALEESMSFVNNKSIDFDAIGVDSSDYLPLFKADSDMRVIPVHLEGIQRSRIIMKDTGDVIEGIFRNRAISSVIDETIEADYVGDGKSKQQQSPSANTFALSGALNLGSPESQENMSMTASKTSLLKKSALLFQSQLLTPEILAEKAKDLGEDKKHMEEVDGHLEFKWDQDMMLRAAFKKMDKTRKGVLYIEDVALVAHDKELQALLKWSVFGTWIKRGLWHRFIALFDERMDDSFSGERVSIAGSMQKALMNKDKTSTSSSLSPRGNAVNPSLYAVDANREILISPRGLSTQSPRGLYDARKSFEDPEVSSNSRKGSFTMPMPGIAEARAMFGGSSRASFRDRGPRSSGVGSRRPTLSLQAWLNAATRNCAEHSLSRQHVRTQEEHAQVTQAAVELSKLSMPLTQSTLAKGPSVYCSASPSPDHPKVNEQRWEPIIR